MVFSRELRVVASEAFQALYKARSKLHPDMLWRMTDIQSFGPELIEGCDGGSFLPMTMGWDGENQWSLMEEEDTPEVVRHQASTPAHVPRRGAFEAGPFIHVAFDGGSVRGDQATAGYIIVDSAGREVVRRGLVLGVGLTNNEAESSACLEALQELARLQDQGSPGLRAPVRVLGDSQLIIRMLLGVYKKVRKPSLYVKVEGIRALVRERRWKVAYRAVPR
jgi:ribonuclease HI